MQSRISKGLPARLFLGLVLTAAGGLGQDALDRPAFKAKPQDLLSAIEGRELPEDADVWILRQNTERKFDKRGLETRTAHTILYIATETGIAQAETISASWSPWRQQQPVLKARVITKDGREHWLDPDTISEAAAGSTSDRVFTNNKQLRGPLPGVGRGAVVEWQIVQVDTQPRFDAGAVYINYLVANNPADKIRVVFDAPASLPLQYETLKLDNLEPQREERKGRVRLTFEVGPVKAAESVPNGLPSDAPRWPMVVASTAKSWAAIAGRYDEIVNEQIRGAVLPASLRLPDADERTRREVIAALTARLHEEIRYTGIEFDEASYVPRRPADTLQRKFGDCKDKAALLIAMLRDADIEAHLALLLAGPGKDVDPGVPGFGRFDHAIVYIPGEPAEPAIWIDATVEHTRPGQLPSGDQDRYALVVAPDTTDLIRTPAPTSKENRLVETREFFLPELGKARIVEEAKAYGSFEISYRSQFRSLTHEELGEKFESYVDNVYLAKTAPQVGTSNLDDLSEDVNVRLEMEDAGRGATSAADAAAAIRLEHLFRYFPSELTKAVEDDEEPREQDYVLPNPYSYVWNYRITPPAGFLPRELPESGRVELGPAWVTKDFEAHENGVVTAKLTFDTGKRRYTPQEVIDVRDATAEFIKSPVITVEFDQVGEVHLKSGRILEAVAEFRALAEADPDSALARGRVARALLAAGLGEAARSEARAALELDPDSKTAHQGLGWILQHDLIGRRFEKGFDHAGAVAAYRDAHAADPEDGVIQMDLAILLEHNDEGLRYGKGALLDEAIVEYRDLLTRYEGNASIQENVLVALLRGERIDELAGELAAMQTKTDRIHMIEIVSHALSQDADRAVDYASQRFADSGTRLQALTAAAGSLAHIRRYKLAAGLLRAAARDSTTAAQTLAQAALYERVIRYEDLELPPDDPATPLKRLYLALLAGDADQAHLEELFSIDFLDLHADAEEDFKKAFDTMFDVQSMRMLRRSQRDANRPPDVLLDLMLSGMETVTEGDDDTGYRLKTRFTLDGASEEIVVFVVREQGRYVLLDVVAEGSVALFGIPVAAIARANAGDLESARTLLDWAREHDLHVTDGDPLAGSLLPRFWHKGSNGDSRRIELAAAALMAESSETLAAKAIPIFEKALEGSPDDAQKASLQLALSVALARVERFEDSLPMANALVKAYPDSVRAFQLQAADLISLKRWEEMERRISDRLERLPDDAWSLHMRLQTALNQLDLATTKSAVEELEANGDIADFDLNNYAWLAMAKEELDDEAVRAAERAADLSGQQAAFALHTLATIYAELGKTAEARAVLLQAMELEGLEEPDSKSWYVVGRFAEHYGVPESARAAYGRVEQEEDAEPDPTSVYALAQRRLSRLD